jgi:hypothetical protein
LLSEPLARFRGARQPSAASVAATFQPRQEIPTRSADGGAHRRRASLADLALVVRVRGRESKFQSVIARHIFFVPHLP